jgi:uncharacterized membrane protein YfcA
MDVLAVSITALLASALTLFSGFGLGTLLMPVVAIFFPVEVAIAITAMVHLANNLFKLGLLGRKASGAVLVRFGLPAVAAAFGGALLLGRLSGMEPWWRHEAFGRPVEVSPVEAVVGGLILLFVALELWPRFSAAAVDRRYLPLGGLVSGFFGGLSGHQGAFRSIFLLKAGLGAEQFVATSAVLAVMVDAARMLVYSREFMASQRAVEWPLVAVASLAAFAGSYAGARLLQRVTLRSIRAAVAALLVAIGLGMLTGLL